MLVEDLHRQHIEESLQNTLGQEMISLTDKTISIIEDREGTSTSVDFSFCKHESTQEEEVNLSSSGRGFIDAVFKGLMEEYSEDYKSLSQIKLSKFSVSPSPRLSERTASEVQVSLQFKVCKNNFTFSHKSSSIVLSAYRNLLKTFEFYMNCEKCFLALKKCVEDARSRNRGDIVSECSYKMADLTKMISYEKLCK